ncbi:MAG: DUF542 domain-containing protein [Burkholderiaceae bacterium]|jgi:iron-sulfur cluster repair protein YtfE (RIC family)|nr:DUF542 domain-containing protein [Burkholderiaceae bacterium]
MEPFLDQSPGQIARQLAGASAAFHACGLDFCCNGNRTVRQAAAQRKLEAGGITPPRAACAAWRAPYTRLRDAGGSDATHSSGKQHPVSGRATNRGGGVKASAAPSSKFQSSN